MESPIRVLQVVTKMDAGGLETLLMNFYRNIDRKVVQFDFLVHRTEKGFYDDEIESLGGKRFVVPSINPLHHHKYLSALDSFFKNNKNYQIVHSHINAFSYYPLRAAMKNGVPIRIAHSHIANPKFDWKTIFKWYAREKLQQVATHRFACSKVAGEWLYKGASFRVINNAIDVGKFRFNQEIREKIRKELGLKDKLIIGHVGRFSRQKNHQFLIDIFENFHAQINESMLVLVGEGELKEKIIKKVKTKGLSGSVLFLGARSDVNDLLQAFDLFLLPSYFEGLPVTLVEAQASGLPCFVSDSITGEIVLTELIRFLSLDQPISDWVSGIENRKNNKNRLGNSKDIIKDIQKKGFDITEEAKKLELLYKDLGAS